MSSCCAVARPRAVRGRQEDLDGAQFPPSWLVLQCGRSTAAAGRRTTCSDGTRPRPAVPITHARQEAWAGTPLACTARSARGLFLLRRPRAWSRASRSVGRPHPSHPSPRHLLPRTAQHLAAHHPTHRRSIGVRARSRERGALVQRHLAPLADPRRRVGLRARVCYAREDGWRSRAWPSDGCCPVSSIHPPPSKLYTRRGVGRGVAWAPSRFCVLGGSVGPAIPSCTLDSVESAMPRSFEFGIKNCGHI